MLCKEHRITFLKHTYQNLTSKTYAISSKEGLWHSYRFYCTLDSFLEETMSSLCWWCNLPSFEINVNTPIDININAPIDFAKSCIWLAVPFSSQIGVLQGDVHAVTQSYLLMPKRDQLSSVFFGHIQEFFKSLSTDRQTSMHNRQFSRLLWENNLYRQEWLQGQTFAYRTNCSFSGLAHCCFLL